ncbi:MAG: class I SAM-dependent methyltransferase, partial [bacterium]|nr:class I SAM-dependent methyltransferase [bacterium]
KLAKKNVPGANYEVKDMVEIEKGEYEVDAVVSFYAIFHTDREKHSEIFKKINSFLPKGGLILVTMGGGGYEGTEKDFYGTTMSWSHYGAEKNKEIIEEAGFEILSSELGSGEEKHLIVIAKKT